VFVVDDDPLVRDSVGDLLASAGFAVQAFGSAADFIHAKRPDIPACLILDIKLPDLSGLDLQTEIASSGIEVPIIFVTGHGDIRKSVRAMKAGAVEFLTKPFRDQELFAAVRQAPLRDSEFRKLGTSELTIKAHRGRVMRKMQEASLADLVRMAEKLGISPA
jgi:FixJ family two-component response regulator